MKISTALVILTLLCCAPGVLGCRYADKGRAAQSGWQAERFDQILEKYVGADASPDMIAAIGNDEDKRNAMINELGYLIDYQFEEFINSLQHDRALFDTTMDIGILSLTTASTIISPASTKTILSGLSAILVGGQTSVDKNFFHKQAMTALASQMRANRDLAWAKIVTKMNNDLNQYSAQKALTDLVHYYNSAAYSAPSKKSPRKQNRTKRMPKKSERLPTRWRLTNLSTPSICKDKSRAGLRRTAPPSGPKGMQHSKIGLKKTKTALVSLAPGQPSGSTALR